MGKEKLRERLKSFGCGTFQDDTYIEILQNSGLIVAKIISEQHNISTIYFGFFECPTDLRCEKISNFCQSLKKNLHDFYDRPIGKILVEETYQKKFYRSRLYSLFIYRPHTKVIKSYMCGLSTNYVLLTQKSAQFFLNILYVNKLKQGFLSIGVQDKDKYLLVKPIEYEDEYQRSTYFIEYMIFIEGVTVCVEFYHEPSIANYYEHLEPDFLIEDLKKEYEYHDEFIHLSVLSHDYLCYKALENKLEYKYAEDFKAEYRDDKIIEFTDDDNIFCYVPNEELEKSENIEELKLQAYDKMYESLSNFVIETDIEPAIDILIRHANLSVLELEIFSYKIDIKSQAHLKSLERLYRCTVRGFYDISDFSIFSNQQENFIRYVNTNNILMWIVPSFDAFIEEIS